MPRSRIFGIYILLAATALGAGILVAQIFGTSVTLPSGYTTPTAAVAQAATVATPTAAVRPTAARSIASTPATTGASTTAPSPEPPTTPPTDLPSATPALTLAPTDLPSATPVPTLAPTEPPTAAADPGYIEYTVERGDILKAIAERYGVTIGEIIAINQIPNPDSLVVGSVIHVPKK
jgi:LysM repeat protein